MRLQLSLTAICNVYIMPKADDVQQQSPFQGYILPLFDERHVNSLARTLLYPRDVCEIFMTPAEVLGARSLARSNNSYLLSIDSFSQFAKYFDQPFTIITCVEEFVDEIKNLVKDFKYNPILVTDGDSGEFKAAEINNAYVFDDKLFNKLTEISSEAGEYQELISEIIKKNRRDFRNENKYIIGDAVSHNIALPGEAVLVSCGYEFKSIKEIEPSLERKNYVDEMVRVADLILEKQTNSKSTNQSDLILYSPSIFSYLYDPEHRFWNKIYRELSSRKKKEFIKKNVIRNLNYSGMIFQVEEPSGVAEYFKDRVLGNILTIRKFELRYTTLAMAFLSIANNCPAIRLPNSINFHPKKMKNLETLSKRDDLKGINLFKREFSEIINLMKDSIGDEIIDYVNSKSRILTLCCDVPIEWLPFDGVPLMFSHEISRIYATPGNMLLSNASNPAQIEVTINELQKVLVLRSFRDNDPIRDDLKNQIVNLPKCELDIEIIDVNSESEVIESLNNYDGWILIFDCHGGDGGNESHGWLNIGNEKVDTWLLKNKTRIPPIVILSACSTSSVCGSHASVANGLLVSGALSVIGTFLPVNSKKSSIFVLNILLKLTFFLKELSKKGFGATSWRTLISVIMKLSYINDILDGFENQLSLITRKDRSDIVKKTTSKIYSMEDDWYEYLISEISSKTNKGFDDVILLVNENFRIVETMYYQQLGRPENLIIKLQ